MRIKSIFSLLLLSALFSCDKENTPEPQEPEPVEEFNFTFRNDTYPKEVETYELILSQKDGKVILDTLVAANSNHSFKVMTNDTKFNVSTIAHDPVTDKYRIKTYVQVNPDKWHITEISPLADKKLTSRSTITFDNITYDGLFFFQTTQINNMNYGWSNSKVTFTYDRVLPTDIGYFLNPNEEKYMFVDINSAETTADFTNASNALRHTFNVPAGITKFSTSLYGYPAAGAYDQSITLFLSYLLPNRPYDFYYPNSVIEEFTLKNSYTDAGGAHHSYSNNGTTIPLDFEFAPKADFTVTNKTLDGFQVTFEDDKPSTYTSGWSSTDTDLDASWHVSISPDETNFKYSDYLHKINSKLLAGKNLSAFQLKLINSQKVKDYTHQDVLDYKADPNLYFNSKLKQSRFIQKSY